MQPKAAIVQNRDKGQIVKFGSKMCFIKSVANRRYYTKIPLTTSTQGDRKYRYFQSRDEYNNYLKRKSGVKVQAPPDFGKSILCSFMGQLCMVKATQLGLGGDLMSLPLLPSKTNPRVRRHQNPNKDAEEAKKKAAKPQPNPQANIFGGTDKPEVQKKKPDAQQSQKAREMQWLMEKIKSGKLPKGAAKLVNPKKTSPKKQAANEEKWETGLFSEGKKQQGLFEDSKKEKSNFDKRVELEKEKWELYRKLKSKLDDEEHKIVSDKINKIDKELGKLYTQRAREFKSVKEFEAENKKIKELAKPDWLEKEQSQAKTQPPAAPESGKGKDLKYASETELQMKYREKSDVFQLLKEKIEIEDYFEKYPNLKSDENTIAQYEAIQELLKKPVNVQQTAYAKRDGAWLEEYNENDVLINREKIGTPGKAQETVDSINHKISEQKRKGKISEIAQSIDTDDLIRQLRLMKNKVSHRENVEIVLDELKKRDIKNYDLIHKEFASNKV